MCPGFDSVDSFCDQTMVRKLRDLSWAQIRVGGKTISLGHFHTDEEAAKAFDYGVIHRDGSRARTRTNFKFDRYEGQEDAVSALQGKAPTAQAPVIQRCNPCLQEYFQGAGPGTLWCRHAAERRD